MSDIASTIIIALLVINLIGLLVVGASIKSQSQESRGLERRLTMLEAQVQTLPTHRDLMDLRGGMGKVMETVAQISGQTEAMTVMLRTIQEHLLESE